TRRVAGEDAVVFGIVKVVRALERGERVDAHWTAAVLSQDFVVSEELDRSIVGAMDANLCAAPQPESIFETDLCAAVAAEEVVGEVSEIADAERSSEAVRDAERAPEFRDAQRRGQSNQREV